MAVSRLRTTRPYRGCEKETYPEIRELATAVDENDEPVRSRQASSDHSPGSHRSRAAGRSAGDHRTVKCSKLEMIGRGGHFTCVERPTETCKPVHKFLNALK